jgi:hypothetical protein
VAHDVCPIDLEEHASEVGRLNAERGECNRRREVLHRELWHCENRLEEVEGRLDDIHAPIASCLTMATDEVVREEDFRSATDCFPLRDPIHLRWAVRTRETLRCITDGDRLRIRVTAELAGPSEPSTCGTGRLSGRGSGVVGSVGGAFFASPGR